MICERGGGRPHNSTRQPITGIKFAWPASRGQHCSLPNMRANSSANFLISRGEKHQLPGQIQRGGRREPVESTAELRAPNDNGGGGGGGDDDDDDYDGGGRRKIPD